MKKFETLLKEYVAIPSISALSAHKNDMQKAVGFLKRFAREHGLSQTVIHGYGNPIVILKTTIHPNKETILVYGHYDVQPAEKSDGWISQPFQLTNRQGKLYGRGSADNKAQSLMHLVSVTELLKKGRLAYNAIFVIEGDEETGSGQFGKFLKYHRSELKCDCVLISDGNLEKKHTPALEVSFRGVINVELSLRVARDDLHSGQYGGLAPNAAEELSKLVSLFSDQEEKIFGSRGHSIEVTTMNAGYLGDGFRNSIPAKALAKINIRSRADSDPKELVKQFKMFINTMLPSNVNVTILVDAIASGSILDIENTYALRAKACLKRIYKKEVAIVHCGATLPIVNDFKTTLKVPQIMVPLANSDSGMHSASENISRKAITKGLAFSRLFFSE